MSTTTLRTRSAAPAISGPLVVHEEIKLTDAQREALGNTGLDNFVHYARFSTDRTQLFFAKVFRGDEFVGLAPIIKTVKYKGTRLLRAPVRRWAGPLLGLLSHKTTYMVDTAFMGFQHANPFFAVRHTDQAVVRDCVFDHLSAKDDVDHIWIAEPAADLTWAMERGLESFNSLPAVSATVTGHNSISSYLESLSKKRRKNFRQDRKPFDESGGMIDYFSPPLPEQLATELHQLLLNSAENNRNHHDLAVPFEDVQVHEKAFLTQQQHVLVARIEGRPIGFFGFFPNGDVIHQCHGGFDYDLSLKSKAYHNLMNGAIQFAIEQGYASVTFGPLNNETKRRIGTEFAPVTAHIWSRKKLVGMLSKLIFVPNFQVYRGPADTSDRSEF